MTTPIPPSLRTKNLSARVAREHGDIFLRGYQRGLAARPKTPRRTWLAIILATIALVLTAFTAGRAVAAPRSEPVIPSDAMLGVVQTDRAQTGAPDSTGSAVDNPTPAVTPAPRPTGGIDAAAACDRPCETLAPVSHGTLAGQATWWNSFGSGLYAAIRPDLGSKGDLAIVCGGRPFHCLSIDIITTCACLGPGSGRLIDLSLDAFVALLPPGLDAEGRPRTPGWQGVQQVTLQVVER